MKQVLLIFFVFIGGALSFSASRASAEPTLPAAGGDIGFFYATLAPYGEWIELASGHRFWRPHGVAQQWRPYLLGRWLWTDHGWYWMSQEPFGWVTYHYGRWFRDDSYGWIWMPDDVWGPAWVEWRYDHDRIGWAPLPPYATCRVGEGIQFSTRWSAPASYWTVIRYRHFGGALGFQSMESEERATRLIQSGMPGKGYRIDTIRIINRGIDRAVIEKRGRMRIQHVDVREVRSRTGERFTRSPSKRKVARIEIFRPTMEDMRRGSTEFRARSGDRNLSLDLDKISRPRIEYREPVDERPPPANPKGNDIH